MTSGLQWEKQLRTWGTATLSISLKFKLKYGLITYFATSQLKTHYMDVQKKFVTFFKPSVILSDNDNYMKYNISETETALRVDW